MATALRKKSPAYEAGVREGAAMRKRGDKGAKVEIEIKPASEEPETEDPEEEMDADMSRSKTNRKRSAKNAKSTKAPMDGGMYGKKPMDGDCGCGGRKGKASCDGSCGKKMDRNDALTPQEYLAACDLGIQGRSRGYIRARLDAAERLDLRCGKGSISEGEKCTKGTPQKVEMPKPSLGQRAKAAGSLLALGTGVVGQAAFTGAAFGAGLSGNSKAAGRFTQAAAGFGAIKGAGLAGIGAKKAAREELAGAATGALVGSYLAGDLQKGAKTLSRARKEGAGLTLKRIQNIRSNAKGKARIAAINNAPLPKAKTKYGRVVNPWVGDSVYATGFTTELDQLAI